MTREWEEQQLGMRPLVRDCQDCRKKGGCQGCHSTFGEVESDQENAPVSCLTAKYQENDWVADFLDNNSVYTLPGQGEQTNDRCGEWLHPLSCPNHGKSTQLSLEGGPAKMHHDRFVIRHNCGKPSCPICYEAWADREANHATDRLIQCVELYRKAGYTIEYEGKYGHRTALIGRIDHWVLSPPQELAIELIRTPGGSRTLRSMAIDLLKKAGIVGAVLIFHPFRQNDDREPNFNPDLPVGIWYLSPHFHVVGCGYLVNSDAFYANTGWVYKKEPRRVSIKSTIRYVLTHAGIAEGFQALTYFGLFSNNKVVIDKIEKITEPIKCSGCGAELHLFEVKLDEKGEMDWDNAEDKGVYLHITVKKTYKIREKGDLPWSLRRHMISQFGG